MADVFAEARRLVSAREVAERNGFHPNRSGFVCCPLHREKTPSLKLYENGTWHCFGCGQGGSSIDLMAALHDLAPLDAVKQLNTDFNLGLDLERRELTAQERENIQRKQQITNTYEVFQEWRSDTIAKLNTAFRVAHLALNEMESSKDFDKLNDSQVFSIQKQPYIAWLSDTLTNGTMAETMEVFRNRKEVEDLCQTILVEKTLKHIGKRSIVA